VEQLLEAVDHLSPAEQREFQRRLAARHGQNGSPKTDQATLIQAARARLPAAAERRLGSRAEISARRAGSVSDGLPRPSLTLPALTWGCQSSV
jgi:hypothetical protein